MNKGRSNDNSKRGLASASEETRQRVARKGGKAAQRSGNAHELTKKERSEGGSRSGGNFKNDPDRARYAGQVGGSR